MNEPTRITLEKASEWFKGDKDAAHLAVSINFLMHVWDDLIDRDKEVSPKDVNDAFMVALVTIPLNQFYRRYEAVLHPILFNAIVVWETSVGLEADKARLDVSHVLRYAGANLFVQMAICVGGIEHARSVSRDIWLTVVEEPFAVYELEMMQKEV